MRLKTLRKTRPAFEIEGTVINGSRMDISNTDSKVVKHRSNHLLALPASLNTESSILTVSPLGFADEMDIHTYPPVAASVTSHATTVSPYHAIEAAYLEHGIRIRLSPTRLTSPRGQKSDRKSAPNLQRRAPFVTRQPSRTSSVLHYSSNNPEQYNNSRSFSALQHLSTDEFAQTSEQHIGQRAQSSLIKEETQEDSASSTPKEREELNQSTVIEPYASVNNDMVSSTRVLHDDPDLAYLSKLLRQPNGESLRENIRRRAGLRGTFSVHRHPLAANSNLSEEITRDKSPVMHRSSLARHTTIAATPTSTMMKVDGDILKHAARIRRSVSKENPVTSPRPNTASVFSSPSRVTTTSVGSSPSRVTTTSAVSLQSRSNTASTLCPPSRTNTASIVTLPSRTNTIAVTNPASRINAASIISSSSKTNTMPIVNSPLKTQTKSTSNTPTRADSVSPARTTANASPFPSSPPRASTIPTGILPARANTISVSGSSLKANSNYYTSKRNTIHKSFKSMSLEPLELLLAPTPYAALLATYDGPKIQSTTNVRSVKVPANRTRSILTPLVKSPNDSQIFLREPATSSSILRDDSLSSMKVLTSEVARQSNSFDSGCYDRSSSGGDIQSSTSSGFAQVQCSAPTVQPVNSATRRSTSNKKVSFFDEPTAVILTTATYV